MWMRALGIIVVLATLMASNSAKAACSASDRPAGINPNTVVFVATSDTTLHVNWSAPANVNIDVIIDDQTAGQSNIGEGKPGGSVTNGLRGQSVYDFTLATGGHNYRLTITPRSV